MELKRIGRITFSVTAPPVEIIQQDGGEYFQGYAAVWFNRANAGTTYIKSPGLHYRVNRNAFNSIIESGMKIPIWYNHSDNFILASEGQITVDDIGMKYTLAFDADDPDHQKVRAKIRKGIVQGSSWQGECMAATYKEGPYLVKEIMTVNPENVVEFSIVNNPAFKAATAQSFSISHA